MPSNSRSDSRRGAKTPTFCSRIERALGEAGDFLTPKDLKRLIPDATASTLHSCLHHLATMKAAGFLAERGQTFWYLTPESDERGRTVAEKILHGAGSRGGKGRVRTTASPSHAAPIPTNHASLAAALSNAFNAGKEQS